MLAHCGVESRSRPSTLPSIASRGECLPSEKCKAHFSMHHPDLSQMTKILLGYLVRVEVSQWPPLLAVTPFFAGSLTASFSTFSRNLLALSVVAASWPPVRPLRMARTLSTITASMPSLTWRCEVGYVNS